ncbi:MAG: DUF4307 domain-containing protein [Actinobacteria bacterium]|nr:DUF4307 domain-containing protein [Actinomycetota bacterium]NBQ59602.1 DUF4307 domain-containing protein [Actinomycetota bacterium]NBY82776.1 DUF4307 domain-containing protein [Actinomycetota bacterium]NCU78450.1 DUF4307 domain-containing protein [Actinomycetota bacterium]NCU96647.1 DUF4307 domain-containing protein [Actinomycetota bacterium]
MTHPKVLIDPRLRERYGIKSAGKKRIWITVCSLFIVLAWFIWSGTNFANPDIRSTLISFKVVSDQKISITYKISVRDTEIDHSCSLVAKDIDKNTVGEVIDLIPAGSLVAGENQRTIEISTRIPAVNAGIASCQ